MPAAPGNPASAHWDVHLNLHFLFLVLPIHEVGKMREVQVQLELHIQPRSQENSVCQAADAPIA